MCLTLLGYNLAHQNLGCQGIAGVYLDGVWEGIGSPKRLSVFFPSILTLPHYCSAPGYRDRV